MNYHHAYHAGHSADVFKHFVVYQLLKLLTQKEKPLSYIETHAGFAHYDLNSAFSQTTKAYQEGIELLRHAALSNELNDFLTLCNQFSTGTGSYYPGSAAIAHACLRKDDVLFLADINVEATKHLKKHLTSLPKTHISNQDGYALLNTWLPPQPARGLVLIDPPYEKSDDWEHVIQACQIGFKRWAHGIYVIWYPIKNTQTINTFYQKIKNLPFENKLIIEFCPLAQDVEQRLNGTGLIILNPPWKFKELITPSLEELFSVLSPNQSGTLKIQ